MTEKRQTVREEFEEMWYELRRWNRKDGWDGTPYCYHIEHFSKKSQTMLQKMLDRQKERLDWDRRHGFADDEEYSQKAKVISDCQTSINEMFIL
ncbi:MAG: hypothetical protein LUG99_08905 [Lachnospiraceae bacterium]|nr:hypothetical protein [Lachnospiraceae bacterium]